MSPLDLIYALFIGPLELFFEVLYAIAFRFTENPGVAIIFLSLAMNFLVLPLYRRADAMQEEQRDRAARMKRGNDHIKKTFSGDERFMMQQTFNRQNGYKPTDALKGSVSLLLEIPFFIAAFHFLSNLALLRGVPFGPIADLGAPDALIQIGGITINFLPILMTAINVVAAVIYMKGMPVANKVQMYGIAAIFLVLLYNSPSGLVFYWTLNNLFSLVKNIFYKLKRPGFVLCVLSSIAGLCIIVAFAVVMPRPSLVQTAIVIAAGLLLQVPIVVHAVKSRAASHAADGKKPLFERIPEATPEQGRAFVLSGLFLALLTGAVIPLAVIQASPGEFVNVAQYTSPLWYVAYSTSLALGLFVVWFGVFYWLASPRGRTVFACALFAACGVAVVDYLFFGTDLGTLSTRLRFDTPPVFSWSQVLLNAAAAVAVAAAFVVLWRKGKAGVQVVCTSMCLVAVVMAGVSIANIVPNLDSVRQAAVEKGAATERAHAALSKDGKNVVVIMMDRAISEYLPFILHEKPNLKQSMQGFTFYPNTVSYGAFTNVGSPGLYGGYDYTPENMNARSDVSLGDKQNEALQVMPSLFLKAGFDATWLDPTYAGYSVIPDLTALDGLEGLKTYYTLDGSFDAESTAEETTASGLDSTTQRNFFCYGLFKASPLIVQPFLYHGGDYNSTRVLSQSGGGISSDLYIGEQVLDGVSRGTGADERFMKPYMVLKKMPEITPVEEGNRNTFLLMSNDTAHEPTVLQEPEYEPAMMVDNTEFDQANEVRYDDEGNVAPFPHEEEVDRAHSHVMHYAVNVAAVQGLCNWFDYLREQGVYDNTRIIIVSDHAQALFNDPSLVFDVEGGGETTTVDTRIFNCMLLVKDFNSTEFTVSNEFMTNADTPTLAMQGLIQDPVNPYTGNPVDSAAKSAPEQHLLYSLDFDIQTNRGNTFLPGYWFSVRDDISKRENWNYLGYY